MFRLFLDLASECLSRAAGTVGSPGKGRENSAYGHQ